MIVIFVVANLFFLAVLFSDPHPLIALLMVGLLANGAWVIVRAIQDMRDSNRGH